MSVQRTTIRDLLDSLRRLGRNDQMVLSVLAVAIGAAAGGAAILFRQGIAGVQWLFYGFSGRSVATLAAELPFSGGCCWRRCWAAF